MNVSLGRRLSCSCALFVLLALAALALPCPALAATFKVERMDIQAVAESDGSLEVTERRDYRFSEYVNGIFWDVPRGTYEGRQIETKVHAVEALTGTQTVLLPQVTDSDDGLAQDTMGAYEIIEEPDCLRLKIYWPSEAGTVSFRVSYIIPDLLTRWSDTAELYWQYVPAKEGAGGEWTNITATVHLPVPAGEPVVPGENVRAWAHGPLDGELDIKDSTVVFFSPGVGSAEFLEARIAFPPSWLSRVTPVGEARLQTILDEEKTWAEKANAQRRAARMANVWTSGMMGLAAIGTTIATALSKRRNRDKWPEPTFTDTYFRDVPSNSHPALLGMLYRGDSPTATDMTATLMHLTNQGRLVLEPVTREKKGRMGKVSHEWDYRLVRKGDTPNARYAATGPGAQKIDDAAMAFLFDTVADIGEQEEPPLGSSGEPFVLVSHFAEAQKKDSTRYANAYSSWYKAVKTSYPKCRFTAETNKTDGIYPGILGLIDIGLCVILGGGGAILQVMTGPLVASMGACFASALYAIWNTEEEVFVTYTQEASDLKAKMDALKRWLCDFTRLEEAIPTDVVLWNRLLVMATVLGVADKVIAQLRVAAPALLEDLDASQWFDSSGGAYHSPINQVGEAMRVVRVSSGGSSSSSGSYHSVSNSSLSSSRNSSSRGSGGGFSSGGGGGFSGGGRGGTF